MSTPFPTPANPDASNAAGFGQHTNSPLTPTGWYQAPAPEPRRRGKKGALIAGGVALALVLGLGGGAAWAMNSYGDYPYQHIAGGATVYAQLNMTPSMYQRVQASSFLSKLPKGKGADLQKKISSSSAVAKQIIDAAAPGNKLTDYSWAGDRFAIVVYGPLQNLSGVKPVYVLEAKDALKATNTLNNALSQSYGSENHALALGNDYVAVGTNADLAKVAAAGPHLDATPAFKNNYDSQGALASYWISSDKEVATGALTAGWSSMHFEATGTDATYKVSAAAQAANKRLTAANSVADPILNAGLADPAAVFGPDSAVGQRLLAAAGAYTSPSESSKVKKSLTSLVNALGDNVSFSANEKSGRVLLHGATEAQVDKALSQISGQHETLKSLAQAEAAGGQGFQVQQTADGLLVTYGADASAHPADLSKVHDGVVVVDFDLDKLPKDVLGSDSGKWGTVSLSVTPTTNGTRADAEWDLP